MVEVTLRCGHKRRVADHTSRGYTYLRCFACGSCEGTAKIKDAFREIIHRAQLTPDQHGDYGEPLF